MIMQGTDAPLRKEIKMSVERNSVDQLVNIREQIAELKKEEAFLLKCMKINGAATYQGTDHYVTVSEVERETLDMKAVRKKLSPQFKRAHTKITTCLMVRVWNSDLKKVA